MIIATLLLASSFAADIGWLAGNWRGTMSGGQIEEVWTPSAGGVMMGIFRMLDPQGQALFYEFQVIEETASELASRSSTSAGL